METPMTNEKALTMVEHAIDYLSGFFGNWYYNTDDDAVLLAIGTLHEAHKAIGPLGQIPSWEE
jgi:hypothetical protein